MGGGSFEGRDRESGSLRVRMYHLIHGGRHIGQK